MANAKTRRDGLPVRVEPALRSDTVEQRTKVQRLFNHRVGADQKGFRDFQSHGLCGLEIGDKLEARRCLDGQVARLSALEDAVDVICRPPIEVARLTP